MGQKPSQDSLIPDLPIFFYGNLYTDLSFFKLLHLIYFFIHCLIEWYFVGVCYTNYFIHPSEGLAISLAFAHISDNVVPKAEFICTFHSLLAFPLGVPEESLGQHVQIYLRCFSLTPIPTLNSVVAIP